MRAVIVAALLMFSGLARAQPTECVSESQRGRLSEFRDHVAAAATPAEAKEMVLRQARFGHVALEQAARMAPEQVDIQEAQARLSSFEAGVAAATTQGEVAEQLDGVVAAEAESGGCVYTPVEIIVIVIGFILGILPGILFLFLFC